MAGIFLKKVSPVTVVPQDKLQISLKAKPTQKIVTAYTCSFPRCYMATLGVIRGGLQFMNATCTG